jgi:hypothetical protein
VQVDDLKAQKEKQEQDQAYENWLSNNRFPN